MKIKDKKHLIIILMFILLISIVIIYLFNNTKILNKILGVNQSNKGIQAEQSITYKIYQYVNNEGKLYINMNLSSDIVEKLKEICD